MLGRQVSQVNFKPNGNSGSQRPYAGRKVKAPPKPGFRRSAPVRSSLPEPGAARWRGNLYGRADAASHHLGRIRPRAPHQRNIQAIPITENRAVARGNGSGRCKADGGLCVMSSIGKSPNATCRGCRRIFWRKRLRISSTCPGFSKSIVPSRVSAVVNYEFQAV